MAHDDRYSNGPRSDRWRGEQDFGRGEGGQRPHPQRLGDRNYRGLSDDPDAGAERYGGAPAEGFGPGSDMNLTSDADSLFGAPGYDPEFGGPRFDRADVGMAGTHGAHPVSSAFGGSYSGAFGAAGGGYGSSARQYAIMREQRQGRQHDPHYDEWRSRQIAELDRDYDDYRAERQSRFERDFGAWRERRGQQRQAVGQVREHMDVVGSDGSHVGTVDKTSGDQIVLTKSDPSAGGVHHFIPCSWIDSVDDKVRLNLSADEAMERWRSEARSRALFERDYGGSGPHVLNRSFSGTYRDEE